MANTYHACFCVSANRLCSRLNVSDVCDRKHDPYPNVELVGHVLLALLDRSVLALKI
jgi:hypothetical protein